MKIMTKIALAFIIATGFSLPAYAAGGDPLTITVTTATCPGPNFSFTPSGNTLMLEDTSATEYYIGSASSKTTTTNGLEYCMVSGYNGYYQKVQAADNAISAVTAAGTAITGWAPMGGTEGETEGETE